MIRRMFTLGAMALMAFMVLAPAAQAQYTPPGNPGASVSDSTVSSGDTVTVTASGCEVGSTVDFFLDGNPLGSGVADANGDASADVVISGSPGTHTISNSCNDLTVPVVIAGGATAGALPRTGTDSSLPLAKIAAVLIVAGGLLIIAARKRSVTA